MRNTSHNESLMRSTPQKRQTGINANSQRSYHCFSRPSNPPSRQPHDERQPADVAQENSRHAPRFEDIESFNALSTEDFESCSHHCGGMFISNYSSDKTSLKTGAMLHNKLVTV